MSDRFRVQVYTIAGGNIESEALVVQQVKRHQAQYKSSRRQRGLTTEENEKEQSNLERRSLNVQVEARRVGLRSSLWDVPTSYVTSIYTHTSTVSPASVIIPSIYCFASSYMASLARIRLARRLVSLFEFNQQLPSYNFVTKKVVENQS